MPGLDQKQFDSVTVWNSLQFSVNASPPLVLWWQIPHLIVNPYPQSIELWIQILRILKNSNHPCPCIRMLLELPQNSFCCSPLQVKIIHTNTLGLFPCGCSCASESLYNNNCSLMGAWGHSNVEESAQGLSQVPLAYKGIAKPLPNLCPSVD